MTADSSPTPHELKTPLKILILVPLVLLILGIYHGVLQVLYRAGVIQASSFLGLEYYQGLTLHGVVNAIVLTTYFAVAYGHFSVAKLLGKKLNATWVWISTLCMLIGTLLAAGAILSGHASVLYTFYPPLMAHPTFYIGLTLTVVGSWIALYTWIAPYLSWRRENPSRKTPMGVVGVLATFIVWQLCTLPVAYEILFMLLPWSLGWVDGVNALLARTLFWFFGHPLVYFWLLPAYTMYYSVLPKVVGGKLYSDFAGRFVFLSFCVLSAPLGLHHQFADPGIASQWKGIHTVLTSLVALPSMMTAFTMAASLEYAGKSRGGRGLFQWWSKLPYWDAERWIFPYLFCGLIIFIFGGATGVVNASYNVNNVVHNTAWIPAHFHLTVGGPVFLAILGMSLLMLANVSDKKVSGCWYVLGTPYMWTLGVAVMSSGMFIGGLQGAPRRTNMGLSYANTSSAAYHPTWEFGSMMAVVGGILMATAFVMFFISVIKVLTSARVAESAVEELPVAEVLHDEDIGFVQNFRPWIIAGVIAVILAYTVPLKNIVDTNIVPAKAYHPSSPIEAVR